MTKSYKRNSTNSKSLPFLLVLASMLIIMTTYFLIGGLLRSYGMGISEVSYFSFIIGTYNLMAFFLLIYVVFAKVLGENFGLNTGNPFLFWVKENLGKLRISSTEDLYECLSETKFIRNIKTDDLKDNLKNLIRSNVYNEKKILKGNQPIVLSEAEISA